MARVQAKLHQVGLRYPVRERPPGGWTSWRWTSTATSCGTGPMSLPCSPTGAGACSRARDTTTSATRRASAASTSTARRCSRLGRSSRVGPGDPHAQGRMMYALIHGDLYTPTSSCGRRDQRDHRLGRVRLRKPRLRAGPQPLRYCKDPVRFTLDVPLAPLPGGLRAVGWPGTARGVDLLCRFARLLRFCDTVFYITTRSSATSEPGLRMGERPGSGEHEGRLPVLSAPTAPP